MVLIATNAGAILRHSDSGDGAFPKNWYRRAVVGSMGKDGASTNFVVEALLIRNEVRSFHSPNCIEESERA
jgi:hypothetical protein